jgi:hypothetical protein
MTNHQPYRGLDLKEQDGLIPTQYWCKSCHRHGVIRLRRSDGEVTIKKERLDRCVQHRADCSKSGYDWFDRFRAKRIDDEADRLDKQDEDVRMMLYRMWNEQETARIRAISERLGEPAFMHWQWLSHEWPRLYLGEAVWAEGPLMPEASPDFAALHYRMATDKQFVSRCMHDARRADDSRTCRYYKSALWQPVKDEQTRRRMPFCKLCFPNALWAELIKDEGHRRALLLYLDSPDGIDKVVDWQNNLPFHVHHHSYDHYGAEALYMEDLTTVCSVHHGCIHGHFQ